MGTPEFAIPSLQKVRSSRHRIVGIVTQPDKPRGRGRKLQPSPVKRFALEHGIDHIWQPFSLTDQNFLSDLHKVKADVFVVVAFRVLPDVVFSLPPSGTINVHPSLLPQFRGAAPINWTIINGEKETGVTIIRITRQVDAGGILLQKKVPVYADETAGHLHDRLAALGAELLVQALDQIHQGKANVVPQRDELATPAPKLQKEDCHILFHYPAEQVKNRIHGLSPFPTAFSNFKGERINLYRAKIIKSGAVEGAPGTVVRVNKDELWIACNPGIVSLLEVQKEGKKRMVISEFLLGFSIKQGERLE